MTVLVDLDDVLIDSTRGWVEFANARLGTRVRYEDLRSFDVSAAFEGYTHDEIYAMQLEPDMWRLARPIPGAVEALTALRAAGHRALVVTNSGYACLQVKMEEVLFRYFPFFTWRDVILTAEKQLIRGDVLIDDAPHNLNGGSYEKLLFTAPHNRAYPAGANGMQRVDDWAAALAALLAIAGKEKNDPEGGPHVLR